MTNQDLPQECKDDSIHTITRARGTTTQSVQVLAMQAGVPEFDSTTRKAGAQAGDLLTSQPSPTGKTQVPERDLGSKKKVNDLRNNT